MTSAQRLRSAVAFMAIAAHNAEEGLFAPRWVNANADLLTRYVGSGVAEIWAAPAFRVALAVLTLVLLALAIAAARAPRRGVAVYLLLGVVGAFAANALFPHLAGALALRAYVPGVVTAIVLVLPVAVWVFISTVRDGYATQRGALLAATVGVALYAAAAATAISRVTERPTAQSYLITKARYVTEALARAKSGGPSRPYLDSAMKDLEIRLRTLIGPVSFDGTRGTFNPAWLYRQGEEGGELDAISFGTLTPAGDGIVLVTNEEVLRAWVRAEGDSSSDPFVGLTNDNVLTWVLNVDAHATIYTNLRRHASLPYDVPLALLITHAQDVVGRTAPKELVVGIRRGSRAVIVFAKATLVPPPAECVRELDAAIQRSRMYFDAEENVFLSCFDRLVPQTPEFQRAVAQTLEWNRKVRARIP